MLDLERLDNLPMREAMKVHYGWREWRSYVEWNIAKRILKSHIGKPFNVAYSNFCHKIKPYHDKSVFLSELSHGKYRYYISDYYIDDNGLIQKTVENKPKKPLYIYSNDYKTIFVYKDSNILKDHFVPIYDNSNKYHKRLLYYILDRKVIYHKKYRWLDKTKLLSQWQHIIAYDEDFVEKVISGSRTEVTSKNDYRYKRHWANKLKAKKSLDKKQKDLKQQEYSEKQKNLMQEKKRKDKELNDLKILAAGFDLKTSFRN